MHEMTEVPALKPAGRQDQLQRLADVLDRARSQGATMTYLQAADAIRLRPPQRIHQLTELLETLIEHDHQRGQPIRAALVVSRSRSGRPADGFYLKAQAVGAFKGQAPEQYHEHCLQQLFQDQSC